MFNKIIQETVEGGYRLPDIINTIIQGDSLTELKKFPTECIDTVICSPPYYALRDYHVQGQLGLEPTYQEYISKLISVFDEVKRVLKKEGSLWIVLADCYNKNKSLNCIPERFAVAMTDNGWCLRNRIVWQKPNAVPSSIKDRFTIDYENVYFFTKSRRGYYFETQYEPGLSGIRYVRFGGNKYPGNVGRRSYSGNLWRPNINAKGRIKRSVWKIPTQPYNSQHFAVFPEKLIETPIRAGSPPEGIILDPFCGSGTTGIVAYKNGRKFIGIELNPEYIKLAEKRLEPFLKQMTLIEATSYKELILGTDEKSS